MTRQFRQTGATLVELVVSIVILSVSTVGIMVVITQTTTNSANPMVRVQATAIAQAYMEEILSKRLIDPVPGADNGGLEAGETHAQRSTLDDVNDYDGLVDDGPLNQDDQPYDTPDPLAGYNVRVDVDSSSNIPGESEPATEIIVTVTFDGDADFVLPMKAYRSN